MINLLWKQILLKFVGFITKEAGDIIDFLHTENKILRSKINGRVILTDYDKMLLVKHGIQSKIVFMNSFLVLWNNYIHHAALR